MKIIKTRYWREEKKNSDIKNRKQNKINKKKQKEETIVEVAIDNEMRK